MARSMVLALVLLGAAASAANAKDQARTIWEMLLNGWSDESSVTKLTWENLIPAMSPLKNFLDTTPPDQQEALANIDYLNTYPERNDGTELPYPRDEVKKRVEQDRQSFSKRGIDIDALYEKYSVWVTEFERRGKLTDKELDGKQVAIAGYLLPLEFDPQGTKEFLLVPFVGACIHVPPPPPNQVIYIKSTSPYRAADLFEGVLITGRMRVQPAKTDFFYKDGSNDVDSSYTLENAAIEPYDYSSTSR
jgi:hypothetical protein